MWLKWSFVVVKEKKRIGVVVVWIWVSFYVELVVLLCFSSNSWASDGTR
jgi:hypothetical protein